MAPAEDQAGMLEAYGCPYLCKGPASPWHAARRVIPKAHGLPRFFKLLEV
jgi:hypothetical protein